MKCVCGYKHGESVFDPTDEWSRSEDPENGKDPFIQLDMKVSYTQDFYEYSKYLYVCPKCGTVKIDI